MPKHTTISNHNEHKRDTGRPKKLAVDDRWRLGILASKNRRMSIENVRHKMINRGTVQLTIRTHLLAMDWPKSRGIPSPLLKPEPQERGLNCCLEHRNYNWDNVTSHMTVQWGYIQTA